MSGFYKSVQFLSAQGIRAGFWANLCMLALTYSLILLFAQACRFQPSDSVFQRRGDYAGAQPGWQRATGLLANDASQIISWPALLTI